MDKYKVFSTLTNAGFEEQDLEKILKLLIWFGFLGIQMDLKENPKFAYQVRHNIDKLLTPARQKSALFVIHQAFRKALECHDYKQPGLDGI